MKISDIELPEGLDTEGLWVRSIPDIPGVAFRVRPLWNADYRRLQTKLIDALPQSERLDGKVDPKRQDEITAACLAETVLVDWSGFEDANDKPVPYSKALAKTWMTDPRYLRVRRAVVWAASQVEERGRENLEVDLGN